MTYKNIMSSNNQQSSQTNDQDAVQLELVVNALNRVNDVTKQMVMNMSKTMRDLDIIRSFNQLALDLFTIVGTLVNKYGKGKDIQINGYRRLFDNAIKINVKMPIDQFTLIILEFAPEIYEEKEDCFLNMAIPDTTVQVSNEFAIIRSEMFKDLWKSCSKSDREQLKSTIIPLTTFAHAFFYQSVLQFRK